MLRGGTTCCGRSATSANWTGRFGLLISRSRERKKESMAPCKAGRMWLRVLNVSEGPNIASEGGKSATYMATAWWIPFPKNVRNEFGRGSSRRTPAHPSRKRLVSIYLRQPSDVDRAIELLHLSYEIATEHAAT